MLWFHASSKFIWTEVEDKVASTMLVVPFRLVQCMLKQLLFQCLIAWWPNSLDKNRTSCVPTNPKWRASTRHFGSPWGHCDRLCLSLNTVYIYLNLLFDWCNLEERINEDGVNHRHTRYWNHLTWQQKALNWVLSWQTPTRSSLLDHVGTSIMLPAPIGFSHGMY